MSVQGKHFSLACADSIWRYGRSFYGYDSGYSGASVDLALPVTLERARRRSVKNARQCSRHNQLRFAALLCSSVITKAKPSPFEQRRNS